jgi:hypothetical protein
MGGEVVPTCGSSQAGGEEEAWREVEAKTRTSGPTKKLVKAPTKKTLQLYNSLPKSHSSVLLRRRTGRIGLKKFLHKIGVAETGEWDCGLGLQSPIHVLMQCPLRIELRREMFEGIGRRYTDFNALISEPKAARYVAKFMLRAGLLTQFKAVELAGDEGREGPGAVEE